MTRLEIEVDVKRMVTARPTLHLPRRFPTCVESQLLVELQG